MVTRRAKEDKRESASIFARYAGMRCPDCQLDSPDGATACAQCGVILSRACARCGFENPAAFRFCGQCAAPLAAPLAAPPPAASEPADGERRRVTVLFCDLVGAARLSERLDPEDMHRVVRAYQAAAEAVIERHGGHVAQYLGDGLLVYFGYPEEREGSARSAALAALEIVEAVEGLSARLDAERGVDIAARIGMHSGEGVAGDVGGRLKREQLVVGRAPNIAARLREFAAPGTVLASDATKALVEEDVELLSLGARTLRGIAEPVGVFRVLWKKQGPVSVPGEKVREAPLAGDRAALDALVAAGRRAVAGEGRLVLVRGAEGSGKSRLVREARAALSAPGVRVQIARCRAKARSTPLAPFIEALDVLIGRGSALAALPSEPLTSRARGERIEARLVDRILGIAAERALALVVEDLHLADPSSLSLFARLAERAEDARLLLVGTFASPFEPPVPGAGALQIDVAPLDPGAARELLRAAVGAHALAPEVEGDILSRAGGSPLLTLELGRAAARTGAVLDLRAAVLATLGGLGPAREVAWMASVLGPRFERDALGVLCPFDPPMLARLLERLTDAGILAAEEDGELSFSHALVRDAIYEAIPPVRRRDAHEKAARALAKGKGAAAQGAMVAWHLERAGLAEEAAQLLAESAREALSLGAGAEPLAMLSRAIDLVTESLDGPRRLRLEVELRAARARALLALEGPSAPGVEQQLSRAGELCRRVDAPVEMLHIVLAQWKVACWQGNGHAALSRGGELSALAARGASGAWRACAALTAGTTAFYRGRLSEALACLDRAIDGEGAADHAASLEIFGEDLRAAALSLRAWIEALTGDRAASLVSLERAAEIARSLADPEAALRVAATEMLVHHDLEEPEAALGAARRALDLASRQCAPAVAAAARCVLGWALGRAGSTGEGIAEIEAGIEALRARGRKIELSHWDALLADTCLRASRFDEAARALDEAMTLAGTQLDAVFKPEVLRLQGDLAAARDGDLARASALHQRSAETARTYGATAWARRASLR